MYILAESTAIVEGGINIAGGTGGTVSYRGGNGGEGRKRIDLLTK